jgi:uncharacterized protein (DUF2141 family)
MKFVSLLAPALAGLLAVGDVAAADASLTVAFQGIKTPKGALMVALVDEAGYGGKTAPVRAAMTPVTGDRAQVVINGLAPGRYAIRAFHDVDGDGKMKTNPFGIPLEPVAFSNNAQIQMAPPAWSEAAFEVAAGANTHTLSID